jgi:glyoxylase-like metal-dependent hydrolase (beta-lactamase superfamily II)
MHEAGKADLEIYRDPESSIHHLREMLADHGISSHEIDELSAFEDWGAYISEVVEPTTWLHGDETFDAADKTWSIVHTPGHSAAHVCVWEPSRRILISGDHLLPTITPHIDFKRGDQDPLGEFIESLEKVEALDPALVLPGHGRPFDDGAERARIIQRHHDRRLGSILQVIRHEPRTADEITDEIFGSTLLHFQRRLALGETLAHLAYLRRRREVERIERPDGTYAYRKVGRRNDEDDE